MCVCVFACGVFVFACGVLCVCVCLHVGCGDQSIAMELAGSKLTFQS